ncbi:MULTISPECIES: sugar transferase [unclassified Exiguobacterium]|uniref:sugar transferase n=1 Tax=unclassified Exiguobacterium TaxID=2644629 RepID=UPI001BE77405|nr:MULTISPECIES: sugar transferase [unclassified Exiguobacterium]
MSYMTVKRLLGFTLALVACIVLIPVFLCIMGAIKIESRGPVFFKQKRVGLKKSHFNILKFRTMYIETPQDTPTHLLADPDVYITRVGKFLRKTSLDELPQLFNILKGEMSFVGPRPALWNQYDLIDERDKYRANDTLPGLTGWAQINGRDELPIEIKARFDGEYIKQIGFFMDVRCFALTIISVLKSDGIVEGNIAQKKIDEIASTKE